MDDLDESRNTFGLALKRVQSAFATSPADGPTSPDRGLVKELADSILGSDHFACDPGRQLYVFENGAYRPHGEAAIMKLVKAILEANGDTKRWSSHRAREVAEFIRVDAALLWERPPADVLNVANGLLDLTTRTLRPHSPQHLSSVQLPMNYTVGADCPLWDAFVKRVLPEDCRTFPYELLAASIRGEVSDQTAVLAVGPGGNGKSTLLDAVVAALGRENVSGLSLQRLESDKFSVVRLLGKLANVCADLPSDHLSSTSTFKALTGGDRLTGERKFQGSFEFTPFCRLIFSTNHYPQSKDSSQAFFRRWYVVPFDTILEPREIIPDLAARLSAPGELSGALNKAIALLPNMINRGGFTQNETTRSAKMEFQEMTDPLAAWVDRFTHLASEGMVTKKDLLIAYNGAAEVAGRPPMSPKALYAGVKRLRPTIQEAQRSIRGRVEWVFLGLELVGSASQDSTHSHDFFQISLACQKERENEEKTLNKGNAVNAVNGVNGDFLAEEVLSDDH